MQDFQEHQNEIHSKLIAIMGDRTSAHVKVLQASFYARVSSVYDL
jgi:vacuolar protein sorting-associated protein 54